MSMSSSRWHWVPFSAHSTFTTEQRAVSASWIQQESFCWRDSHIGGRTDLHIVFEAFTLLRQVYDILSRKFSLKSFHTRIDTLHCTNHPLYFLEIICLRMHFHSSCNALFWLEEWSKRNMYKIQFNF